MNAIILAAGLGSRFGETTKKNHKALLPINGLPNIERTITYLKEFDVNEIHIVTGHMNHLFDYLQKKYTCNLIYNNQYKKYNSIYSFYCAQKFFNDTLIIDADVVFLKNFFQKSLCSHYYIIQRSKSEKNEWIPYLNDNYFVEKISINSEYKPSLLGVSYWCQKDCLFIKKKLQEFLQDKKNLIDPTLYWDHIPLSMLKKLKVKTFLVNQDYATEMDDFNDYKTICNAFF